MNNIIRLTEFRNDLNKLLEKFQDSSDGMFLSVENESKLKQLVLEIRDILDEEFGQDNRYSLDIYYTHNTEIGGFGLAPTYKCVSDIIAIVNASITKMGNEKDNMKKSNNKDTWGDIKNEFNMSKRAFGKKINFVIDPDIRNIIFRNTANAYYLAYNGYYKSSVILAGSVIEELLRLYLIHNNIKIKSENFYTYIKTCEDNKLLLNGISQLTDSARHFRNFVHIHKENIEKLKLTKTKAINTVTSIFILVDDF